MFFELIKIALGEKESFSHNPSEEEWNEIYALANKHGIAGILYQGLKRLPLEQRPQTEIMVDWFTLINKMKDTNLRLQKQCAFATKTFMKHGFRSVILKGQSLSEYYPDPELRHSSDIDIWLEGTKQDILDYICSVKKPNSILYHHVDFKVIKGTSIEVHFTPSFFANPFINARFQKWIKTSGKRLFPKCDQIEDGYNIPDLDFNIPYLITHFFRHLIDEELEIKPVIDYYYVLKSSNISGEKKQEYMKLLKSFGLGHFTGGVMYILKEACGLEEKYMLCPPNEKYGKALLEELFRPIVDKGCLTELKSENNHIRRFIKREINLFRFFRFYPREIIWTPYWSIKIFLMLRRKK